MSITDIVFIYTHNLVGFHISYCVNCRVLMNIVWIVLFHSTVNPLKTVCWRPNARCDKYFWSVRPLIHRQLSANWKFHFILVRELQTSLDHKRCVAFRIKSVGYVPVPGKAREIITYILPELILLEGKVRETTISILRNSVLQSYESKTSIWIVDTRSKKWGTIP